MLYFNILFLICFLIWVGPQAQAITPTYLYHNCTNTSTFTPNSIYHSNLNHLLSVLSSNATLESYNATAGSNSSTSAHGSFLCRGDVNATVCRDCVRFATGDVLKRCPVEKEAVIWYDECQLRYSNRSFFGTVDERPRIFLYNTANITDLGRFRETLNVTVRDAAAEAASGGRKKYATKEANFTGFQTLYSLVQCTPDLSSADCNRCLLDNKESLYRFSDKQGARLLFPSCNVRFELYPFYNQTGSQLPPVTLPPASVTRPKGKSKISTGTIVAIAVPIAVCIVLFIVGACFIVRRAKSKQNSRRQENAEDDITTVASLQFGLSTIEAATNKFSINNKLGEGGFGEVYKGTLSNGKEIAVKRLSKDSVQGAEEFKNEVVVVAKLQHRNLVRLLGFCLEGEEKLLVYEFVPNKSLDYFLYDPEKQPLLDWSRRYKLIGGIARGILYLHEDSRLRIIHRDLKPSNILLDAEMNPKISDFGMARIFGVDQTRGNTSRIVGTYGYMSPEYAMHGQFSVKSDVYSFGVLIFEIISGKRNSSFYQSDCAEDLLSYAWKLWKEGTPLALADPTLRDSYSENEVLRCIHLGLLCVQEDPDDRPTMASIVMMLNSYSVTLPVPQQPAFFIPTETDMQMKGLEFDQSASQAISVSVNEASITEMYPR
ncbi:hypothetical protein FNV43_RR07749 [Rhamnella rubrinervis]|uniref:Cysteine-rich receptor-like protein kinase 10 n=1 Tax=Rhamnella rubrinervis TaxID=2594499 RepID=A0A8K0HGH1_9ROSA|nr:hypothetical protein FNV43_RR07749 [Rhamnella rubrinervis]